MIPTVQWGKVSTTDYDSTGRATLDAERFGRVVERQRRLFKQMRRAGGRLAVGSDIYGRTLGDELAYLHDNRIFDNLTLLKIAAEITPQVVFPQRRIGRLRAGYEASFLVLGGDPIEDFAHTKKISLRIKQGVLLAAAPLR